MRLLFVRWNDEIEFWSILTVFDGELIGELEKKHEEKQQNSSKPISDTTLY